MIMIAVGVIGISLSSIFVKLSDAPSAVTALFRLAWTVVLMSPSVLFKKEIRKEQLRAKSELRRQYDFHRACKKP